MSNAERIYGIAVNHAQTVQVCIDRLHELGANTQLKLLTGRLQKLAVQATSADNDKGTKAPRRQQGRPQNLRGNQQRGQAGRASSQRRRARAVEIGPALKRNLRGFVPVEEPFTASRADICCNCEKMPG